MCLYKIRENKICYFFRNTYNISMKKLHILIFSILFLFGLPVSAEDFSIDTINLRPAKTVFLPKGTFIKVNNIKEFSSQFIDEGDEITMLNTNDIYIGETKLIPEKSVFYGKVEKIREPVQGTNASITIRMEKFVTPEGIPYSINGYISADGATPYLGGGRTPALYYVKMPHYTRWTLTKWRVGAAQYCETNTRQFGVHTVVKPGAELFIILQDNMNLSE